MFTSLVLTFWLLGTPPSIGCRGIEDRDRRSFDKRDPITIDVDGDGKLDTIIPRIYKVRRTHWITFDLKTSRGRVLKSFFKYEYGTDESAYWVYALVPCNINKDGRTDLVFYSGDDTTSETVNLVKKGSGFKVHSRRVTKVE
jgi:hypothetical protein